MPELLQLACDEAVRFLNGLDERPVNRNLPQGAPPRLPRHGLGASEALALLTQTYEAGITGSAGPRYFGFVTGGSTPAAIMGDWLTTAYDQNASDTSSSAAAQIEASAVGMLRELLGLPELFDGRFVSGATMSNFVGLAIARQWWGKTARRERGRKRPGRPAQTRRAERLAPFVHLQVSRHAGDGTRQPAAPAHLA